LKLCKKILQKITTHTMCVPHNHVACLHNQCCRGKTVLNIMSVCVCVCVCVYSCLHYPASNLHIFRVIFYLHLWPAWLYYIFPHYLTNGMTFIKKLLNIKCVFWAPLQVLSWTLLTQRRIQQDITNVRVSSCKASTILVRF